jgi:hypothetical protein
MNIWDKLAAEFDRLFDNTTVELVKVTPDERRNGWDDASLTEYLREREAANQIFLDPHSHARKLQTRPRVQKHSYNPHRWRK